MMTWTDSRVVMGLPARVRVVNPSKPAASNRVFQ